MIRCSLCPRIRPPVPSIGPTPATVLLLGEAGHRNEDQQSQPFVGDTGKELDSVYLPLSGIPRSEYHIYNARCCSNKDYSNPTPEQAQSCAETHLGPLLARVQPKIIMPMGAVACSLFPGINLNIHHGIPRPGRWGSWSGIVFPTYHPTAGMRKTAYMIPLMADFNELRNLVAHAEAGTLAYPVDPYPSPDYRIIRNTEDLKDYFCGYWPFDTEAMYLGMDTEDLPDGSPYCLTFSHTPGTGRLIYFRDHELIEALRNILAAFNPYQIWHNYLHDEVTMRRVGLPIPEDRFIDTMVYAYNLCLGGGGDDEAEGGGRGSLSLKVLAYRLLHMRMTSFKDTVYPHSLPKFIDYLQTASALLTPLPKDAVCECGHRQSTHSIRGKAGRRIGDCGQFFNGGELCNCRKFKTDKVATKSLVATPVPRLKTKVDALIKASWPVLKEDLDPWKRYAGWNPEDFAYLHDALGRPPIPSIEHVPEDELVVYACRDADADLRLYRYLSDPDFNPWLFRSER